MGVDPLYMEFHSRGCATMSLRWIRPGASETLICIAEQSINRTALIFGRFYVHGTKH